MWECRVGCCWLMQVGILRKAQSKQVETGDFFNIVAVRKMSGWMKQVPACLLCPYPRAFMRTDQITPEIKVNLQWLVSPQKSIWTSFFIFFNFKCFQLLKCQASTFLFQVCDRKLYPDFFTFLWHLVTKANPRLNKKSMGRLIHNENTVN